MSPSLSILVCGLYERMPHKRQAGYTLIEVLASQAEERPRSVELLTLYDNRAMSVGRKRSILLSMAQGDYFTFVDDDDRVADDYVATLLGAIGASPGVDVITFGQECHHADTGLVEYCRYGLTLPYRAGDVVNNRRDWTGLPAHTMCWRTDLVQDIPFPDGSFGEDTGWVAQACKRAKTEANLDWTGYYYDFDPTKSRTRGR